MSDPTEVPETTPVTSPEAPIVASREELLEAQNLNLQMHSLELEEELTRRDYADNREAIRGKLTDWQLRAGQAHSIDMTQYRLNVKTGVFEKK